MPTNDPQAASARPAVIDPRKEGNSERGVARTWRAATVVMACLLLAGVAYAAFGNSGPKDDFSALPTAAVKRDKLQVKVTEGGTLIARESLDIKSKVEGRRTILEVVPEGTVITQKDVDEGMVLVKLDASELAEREGSREIRFYSAEAANTKAQEDYDIQVKQNESNIALAKLNVKFARMELDRYVALPLAEQLLAEGLESVDLGPLAEAKVRETMQAEDLAPEELAAAAEDAAADPAAQDATAEPTAEDALALGGMARQEIRGLSADVQIAGEELVRAREEYKWSQDLFKEKYISANELKQDELEEQRSEVELVLAQEELRLFLRYGLPKEVEQRLSDYIEAQRDLDRVMARSRSELAQAEAERRSRQASFELEKQRLEDLRETVKNAVITAPQPGRVVYASTTNAWRRMRDPVREGKDVHQNETILIIPDLKTLAAQVNIHETDIEKIKVGQPAVVTVEAMAGRFFPGKVVSVSPVASAAHAWLNPDIKVYQTEVGIDAVPDGLTPGMSATAEITVADLKDVLQVPIEAISAHKGGHICWVKTGGQPEMRQVECGHFTRTSVEIRSGLEEDEVVFLEPPFGLTGEIEDDEEKLLEEIAEVTAAIAEAGPDAVADDASAEGPESPERPAAEAGQRRGGERPAGAGRRQGAAPAQTP